MIGAVVALAMAQEFAQPPPPFPGGPPVRKYAPSPQDLGRAPRPPLPPDIVPPPAQVVIGDAGAPWPIASAAPAPPVEVPAPPRGPSLDASRWRARHPLVLPPGRGVAWLDLAGDLGEARDDLRLVDAAGLQVPYVVEPREHTVRRELAARPKSEAGRTVIALDEATPWARLAAIELAASAPAYFVRTVRVVAPGGGSGASWERTVASASWERRPEDPPAPLRLPLAGAPDRPLRVVIDDGDNPPLAIDRVTAEWTLRRARFVREAGDAIDALWDAPDAGPPRYDLVLVEPRLLAAPAEEATLAPGATKRRGTGVAVPWIGVAVVAAAALVVAVLARALARPRPPT